MAHPGFNLGRVTTSGTAAFAARIRGLTKRYGETPALQDVDLEVAPGELRGLLGLNGAGKTTLLRTMFGLVRADAGSVQLLGRAVHTGTRQPLSGVAGFVEEPTFYGYLTGRANLEVLTGLDDHPSTGIDDALERVGLSGRADDRVAGYSTGMRQRLGIAAALLREPRLLLLDEPTSGLDPAGMRAVASLLRELTARGVAVILSSHLIGELEGLCHTYTILRSGRVVWDGRASQLESRSPGGVYLLVTGDDAQAIAIASHHDRVTAQAAGETAGVHLAVDAEGLDAYVTALVRAGLVPRRLELLASPLETMFFSLTSDEPAGPLSWVATRDHLRAQAEAIG